MARFKAIIEGDRGPVSRLSDRQLSTVIGTKEDGGVRVTVYGANRVLVERISWLGKGDYWLIYSGPLSDWSPDGVVKVDS